MTELDHNAATGGLTGQLALSVRHEQVGDAVVVRATGDLDMATRDVLDVELEAAESLVTSPAPVVLDLTGLGFLASMGLSLLIEHTKRCEGLGSRLIVVATARAVLRPMQITGLDTMLTIVPTVADALA